MYYDFDMCDHLEYCIYDFANAYYYHDKNGCTVKLLLWKKTYKWEDLEIIREDCWNSGRLHLKGIVFSSRRMGKNGKVYSTKKIFQSLQFLNCFFIIFDDEDVERIYALKKKLGKVPEFKKTSENILTQLKDWGVKVEKGENLKKEEKQKFYDEMVRIKKEQKKNK
jgi:hypothetical protein